MVVYGPAGIESCMVVRCEAVYGTDGARSCMKQMHGKDCAMRGTDGSAVV